MVFPGIKSKNSGSDFVHLHEMMKMLLLTTSYTFANFICTLTKVLNGNAVGYSWEDGKTSTGETW